jgi:hypothetical protein
VEGEAGRLKHLYDNGRYVTTIAAERQGPVAQPVFKTGEVV